jgi:hypothetical protein
MTRTDTHTVSRVQHLRDKNGEEGMYGLTVRGGGGEEMCGRNKRRVNVQFQGVEYDLLVYVNKQKKKAKRENFRRIDRSSKLRTWASKVSFFPVYAHTHTCFRIPIDILVGAQTFVGKRLLSMESAGRHCRPSRKWREVMIPPLRYSLLL